MTNEQTELIILVADADAKATLQTLLTQRARALAIRDDVRFTIISAPNRDNGVYHECHDLLRVYVGKVPYALVLLDRHGSGVEEKQSAEQIQDSLEERLHRHGWKSENCRVIVLDPELEIWVWSSSPNVPEHLNATEHMQQVYQKFGFDQHTKPQTPKEAMQYALKLGKKPFSASIFTALANSVSLKANERAFDRLRAALQAWFPEA
jgi:hypothetical protein